MTSQLSHVNLFSDLSNVTLRRIFETDKGWIMEVHGQNSAVCPGCQSISHSRHSRASRERTNRSQKVLFQTQRLRRLGMVSRRSLQFILYLKPREFQKSSILPQVTAWGGGLSWMAMDEYENP
jgi:hypothetical protein